MMNKEQTAGKFEQIKGQLKTTWGKLTDDEIMTYEGKRDQFFGSVKEKYGIEKEAVQKQIDGFSNASDKPEEAKPAANV